MGDADRWLDVVRARFLLEVERSSHVDVYNALPGTSASHKWVTQDARALAKKLLQLWRDEVRNDPNDEKVRQVLTEAVMSRSGKPIDWDSLRKHFDRKPAAQNGDTFGTVHLSVALLMAAAKGIPAELGTHGRISIKGVSEADRRDAEDLLNISGKLAAAVPPMSSHPAPPPTIVFEQTPVAPAVVGRPAPPLDWVSCPTSTTDYRLVVVGEVPEHGLHPVAFVNPKHQQGLWYAQEKPLRFKEGLAFSAYLNIGNPLGVDFHESEQPLLTEPGKPPFQPLPYLLKVYALQHPWEFRLPDMYRRAFLEQELVDSLKKRGVKYCWPPANTWEPSNNPWTIERKPPAIDKVKVVGPGSQQKLLEIPTELSLTSPVTLTWVAYETSYVEVRKALGRDSLVQRATLTPIASQCSVTLRTRPEITTNLTASTVIELPGPGFYRIKLYAERTRRFLDPLHELWIHIQEKSESD